MIILYVVYPETATVKKFIKTRFPTKDILLKASYYAVVHLPFTSEVAGSILSENFLNVARTQCSTHVKSVRQHSGESRGFSPATPVSSHREVDRAG